MLHILMFRAYLIKIGILCCLTFNILYFRESQSLADSSSHMSSAALTELLANLTSQPTLSSQLEEEPIALEHQASQLPLPNSKYIPRLGGAAL